MAARADEVGTPPDYEAGVSIHDIPGVITGTGIARVTVTRGPGRIAVA